MPNNRKVETVVVKIKTQVNRGAGSLAFTLPDGTIVQFELNDKSQVDLTKHVWMADTSEISLPAKLITKS